MKLYKIRGLELRNRFFLAPMLEPNDIAFRLLCKKCGCALTYTGMISPLSKKNIHLEDKPALQLFSNKSKGIREFIEKYDDSVSMWDFNLGCPSKLSKKMQHGVYLQKYMDETLKILKEIRSSTKKPCSVKLRKSEFSIDIAKLAEKIGFDFISIHPRDAFQGYSGDIDYDFALMLKKSVRIPVIFSGNVNENNYKKILKDFDFVMIGREAIGNPNIFSKLTNSKYTCNFMDYLNLAQKYNFTYARIKYQAMNFTKKIKNARDVRREIIKAKSIEDIRKIMEQINKV